MNPNPCTIFSEGRMRRPSGYQIKENLVGSLMIIGWHPLPYLRFSLKSLKGAYPGMSSRWQGFRFRELDIMLLAAQSSRCNPIIDLQNHSVRFCTHVAMLWPNKACIYQRKGSSELWNGVAMQNTKWQKNPLRLVECNELCLPGYYCLGVIVMK